VAPEGDARRALDDHLRAKHERDEAAKKKGAR